MTWMRGLLERVRETVDRRGFEKELDEEIRFHLDRVVERLRATGLDADAARRQALREFGEVGRVKEDARADAGVRWIENVLRDARHAVRGLRRSPGFAFSSVLTLGLGIGATTAIFSVVDGVLLEPLPYPESERLVRMVMQNSPENRFNISMADFMGVREGQTVFESVAAIETGTAAFTGRGAPEEIDVARVTEDWFRVLGVEPAEGRGFAHGEDDAGAPPVVVLSPAFRDRAFGAAADALGSTISLDGRAHTVVGVLSREHEVLLGRKADAWPILTVQTPRRRGPFFLTGIGRLRPDRTIEDARAELDRITGEILPLWDYRDEQARITPYSVKELMLGDVASGLWLMLGAVAGVLLIAVANVGNLFLVRAAGREREIALRASLGATRGRLAGQLVVESLVVAALGGALGVVIAWAGLQALLARPTGLPRLSDVQVDGSVLLATASVTLGAALLFGFAPLARLLAARIEPGARSEGPPRGGWARMRAALVTAEFAIAFALATGAGLLLDSFVRLRGVDPGYDPSGVVTMRLSLPPDRYADYEEMQAFWSEALRRVGETPGVASTGVAAALPPAGSAGTNNFDLLDRPTPAGESEPQALWNYASPEFLSALGVPLVRGRLFDERDRAAALAVPAGQPGPATVVVSESWARRFYPDREVLGAQLYSGGDRSTPMTIVGVIGDVKYLGLDALDDAVVYEPHWQANLRTAHILVRGRGSLDGVVEAVRAQIAAIDPELPISAVETLTDRTSASLARPRNWTTLLGLFAGLGLVLACVGVYGVLSHYVSAQRKEIAIRLSLGAEPASVRKLVVGKGMSLATLGIALGLAVSIALSRWIRALLFEVSPQDPRTLAAVALTLAAVALVTCALPARAATRVDPMTTLRGD
jgi:putative ABC transport system permease protein